MDESQKYAGGLQLVKGARYGRRLRVRTAKEIELEDRMRRAFGRCKTASGGYPSRAVKEIVLGRQQPWSKMALRALEMDEAEIPAETIKATVIGEFAAWLDQALSMPKRAA